MTAGSSSCALPFCGSGTSHLRFFSEVMGDKTKKTRRKLKEGKKKERRRKKGGGEVMQQEQQTKLKKKNLFLLSHSHQPSFLSFSSLYLLL
jgi:hypothetical protein